MGQIYSIDTAQAVGAGVDYEVIKNLKSAVGVRRYEEIAEKAAIQLADRLGKLDRALHEGDMAMCYRHALNVCGVSSQIGLIDVAEVASGVMTCARREDMTALPAVIARLNRVVEASLFSVFDLGA